MVAGVAGHGSSGRRGSGGGDNRVMFCVVYCGAGENYCDSAPVSAVMTSNPDFAPPETTVLEALQIMHDDKILTLPVCESDGRLVGLVDVMDCVHASGGAEGWKSLFDSALDEDDRLVSFD